MFFFSLYSRVFVGLVRCYFILSLDFGCFARFLEHLFGFFIYIFFGRWGRESDHCPCLLLSETLIFTVSLCFPTIFLSCSFSVLICVCVCVCPKPHFRAMASDTGLGANSLKTVMCTINKFKPFGHSLCVRVNISPVLILGPYRRHRRRRTLCARPFRLKYLHMR